MNKAKTVPQRLTDLGDIFAARSKVYGDNYKHFGKVMKGIFPRGIDLRSEEEFNRFCIFVQVVSKITRYGQSFAKGHQDSLDDTSVYAQMLAEVDDDVNVLSALKTARPNSLTTAANEIYKEVSAGKKQGKRRV